MAFRVRTLLEILDGALATVLANTEIDDVNRGSINRTLLEAAALQDADQYLQIARLKNVFSIETATGDDLDERGEDFGIIRLSPTQSTGLVKFGDSNFPTKISSTLAVAASIGGTSLQLVDGSAWPASGVVLIDRDDVGLFEDHAFTRVGNILTLSLALANNHALGAPVVLQTVGSDRVFSAGLVVSVPATDTSEQIDYTTAVSVTLLDGEVETPEVAVVSTSTGVSLNVGSAQIAEIATPPFPTATVTNDAPTQGGRDEETDPEYRQRIKQTIASLSNGTINDLLVAASGVSLDNGQRVLTAQVVEEFADPDVSVYIDDGTGTVTTSTSQTQIELLVHKAAAGQRRTRLAHWPVVSQALLSLKKSDFRGGPGSATTINTVTPGVGTALLLITGAGFTPGALVGRKLIDDNRNFFTVSANNVNDVTVTVPVGAVNPVPGSYAILQSGFLTLNTDYLFNETTGDIELTLASAMVLNDSLVAHPNPTNSYTYYTGLIQEVQRVLNGDPTDLDTYPGVKGAGIKLKVRAPTVQNISFILSVISAFGTVETELISQVQDVVQRYVNALGVGDDVIIAEVIAAVMGVPGITDVKVVSPPTNIIVLDGVIPRTKASLISVL